MWSEKCADKLNEQINMELQASYIYHYLFTYFNRNTVGFRNIADFFNKCSLEEREHAHMFIEYQNKRSGIVEFKEIVKPNIDFDDETFTMLRAFEVALELEHEVYLSLLELHKTAEEANDPQFADFIEGEFLKEQIDAMDELKVYISQLNSIGNDGHGIWNFNENFNKE